MSVPAYFLPVASVFKGCEKVKNLSLDSLFNFVV